MAELRTYPESPDHDNVLIFADLESKRAPPSTTPPAILVCPYWPDIVVYNGELYLNAGSWSSLAH